MSNLIPYLPVDDSGSSPVNLVSNEEQLVLDVQGVSYPVVTLTNGGFYTRGLLVLDKNFNPLVPNTDYIATHKYADASSYTGLEVCGALVILNPAVRGLIYVTAQMVGGDLAFSLKAREDTLAYLRTLGTTKPIWSGFLGEQPLYEDGELRRDRWSLKGVESFILELENIVRAMKEGDPDAEDAFRQYALGQYNAFMSGWGNRLNPHLQDTANPHADTKDMIGLSLVNNYPVATKEQAQAATSTTTYMTPALFYAEASTIGSPPLYAHFSDKNLPHGETAAQIGVYTQAQINDMAAQRLGVNETAVNSALFAGWVHADYYRYVQSNVPAEAFTSGVFSPERLAGGPYDGNYLLRGDGNWIRTDSVFSQYSGNSGTKVFYVGQYNDPNVVLANVSATFADVNAYPVGSIVIWRYQYTVEQGAGNGVAVYDINPNRAIVRNPGGWNHIA